MTSKDFSLENKVAIVTGASKGIGEAIAGGLAEAGAKVVVSSRKQEAVDVVALAFQNHGLDAQGIACNMGNPEDIQALVKKTADVYGGVDIIVNNAAINPVYGAVLKTESAVFDKIIDVNLKGPFELAKTAYPIMKERGGGSIINISSTAGLTPWRGIGMYSVSKAALIQLTKVLAKELGHVGIRAHAICPGLIKTKLSEALWSDEKIKTHIVNETPLGRIGQPEDLAGLAVFLASDASSHMTGGVYVVDGGMV
ncbi:MAG: SDR family NAD(P)-dependent oxidoreductase [bacterium]